MDLSLFTALLVIFLISNFLLFALGGWWFFYHFLGPRIPHRAIHEKSPQKAQIIREIKNSISTQIIFFIMALGLYFLWKAGVTQIYTKWDERGIFYFLITFFLIQMAHDAWFYWTHRWMHEWKWLRKYHLAHHESQQPTPFASLSFHPVEAICHGLFWYIIAFLIPSHALWLWVFYSFMFYINMWGHTGFEFWHKDLLVKPIQKFLNTPTHHNLHHKYHNKNYGIYYNLWDKVCGTNHAKYEEEYRAIKAKTEAHKTSRIMKALGL
ncbi:MAG: sterol desaturase family protein [Bacteriovoracaceae bacterium]|nr:sterol desaturase family protein [Bacteriovoracaceae bacterium]